MRALVALAAIALAQTSALADPPIPVDDQAAAPPDSHGGGGGLSHGAVLVWNLSVDALFTTVHGVEWASGRRANIAVSGLELIATAPAVAFALESLSRDPRDPAMIATAAWGIGLIAKSVVTLVRASHHDSAEPVVRRRPVVDLDPVVMPGGGGGLVVGGTF